MQKDKKIMLESRSEVCVIIGHPKGMKGGMFYDHVNKKVFVSTNAHYLEEDFIIDHMSSSKVVNQI